MYEQFYGLRDSPFELGPDPRFFFPTPSHNEALATLVYGVLRRKGFVVVTGEVGTGKTMLLRKLLESMPRHGVECAFVYNPRLSVQEFLAHVLKDFGLAAVGKTKGEMLSSFNDYLLERSHSGKNTALIVDEAHLLEWDLLEEIRLLTNLETSQHKLLQIVLAGQPELDDKVDSAELRQLKQRIGLRCKLKPLLIEQLKPYIDRRLQLAGFGFTSERIFSAEAIETIYQCSAGIPRIINNLCENCMLASYAKQLATITVDVVREVADDLRLPLGMAASA